MINKPKPEENPLEWKPFERVLISQLQPDARVKITTEANEELVLRSTNEPGIITIEEGPEEIQDIIGQTGRLGSSFAIGQNVRIQATKPTDTSIMTPPLATIEAMGINPQSKTLEEAQRILAKHFPNPDPISEVKKRHEAVAKFLYGQQHVIEKQNNAPVVIEWNYLHAQVSAAILELVNKAEQNDMQLTAEELLSITKHLTNYLHDYAEDVGGMAKMHERKFLLQTETGEKTYNLTAWFSVGTGLAFNLRLTQEEVN